ncbi:mitotic checkpoint regulator, MAD2B-interacting-domain-containing protein [Scleroderma yunnanense]
MLGLQDYGSDSDNETRRRPTKRTKKIAIPSLPLPDNDDDAPPAKKPRMTPGVGKSSLLGMLPAPKQALPAKEKKEERVLGGGGGPGLVFRTSTPSQPSTTDAASDSSTLFVPPALKKGKANTSLDSDQKTSSAPVVDFFSLGSASSSTKPTSSSAPSLPTISSAPSTAPSIPTFRPPSPTLDDPYPGYYQLPSGAYAPYDADYYATYARKWQAEYDKQIRDLEKSQYNPVTEGMQDVDMAAEMEKARREIQEREERKALTAGKATGVNADGEPEMPKMNVKGAKLGSVARSRHQLTTLLTDAYLNREVLEDKIAQARRNRKEAGNKYGMYCTTSLSPSTESLAGF